MTIWSIILFFKCAFVKLFQAKSAYKMFRMEFTEHCCDASAGDWFWAASTQRATFRMIMRLTIWQTFMIEEWTILERLTTILQSKNKHQNVISEMKFGKSLILNKFETYGFACGISSKSRKKSLEINMKHMWTISSVLIISKWMSILFTLDSNQSARENKSNILFLVFILVLSSTLSLSQVQNGLECVAWTSWRILWLWNYWEREKTDRRMW